ncbi:HK97 family phage prohead protease [Nitrobacter vulgaris]|uniref:HK97 family phage prohead protease n=1 Tax=Nitrobacter vulgaris TaxID=29421 RepID=UPI0011174FC9|nr:HK97 family phage prohead protease [Nitrobacter vulgaris]
MQTRTETLRRNTADPAARTVEVVWTTGAPVRRYHIDGYDVVPYEERLIVSDKAIDLSRLNAGAPVLDGHRAGGVSDQLAVVERAWIAGGSGIALLRFPDAGTSARADEVFALIEQGIVRNVSVGYSQDDWKDESATGADDVAVRTVTRWVPHELSLVTIPADAGAQVRSGVAVRGMVARRGALRQALAQRLAH